MNHTRIKYHCVLLLFLIQISKIIQILCIITDGLDSEQRYYLQRSRAKRSDESDLEYANNSITLVVKTSSDLQVLSPDDVAFRLNTRNSAASNQSMANDIPDEDFLSADMKEEVDIQLLYTSDIIYI